MRNDRASAVVRIATWGRAWTDVRIDARVAASVAASVTVSVVSVAALVGIVTCAPAATAAVAAPNATQKVTMNAAAGTGASGVSARSTAPTTPVQPLVKPSAATIAAANELMSLQEDTVVLKAQLKKLDAQAQVAERQASLGKIGPPIGYDDVSVIATQSLGNMSTATVVINDGDEIDVMPGDTLPNGMRVMAIRAGHVIVDRNGHRSTLAVSSQHSQASRYAASGTGMNMSADSRNGMSSFPTVPLPSR